MLLNGKAIAQEIFEEIKKTLSKTTGRKPGLAVLLVGEHSSSKIYVNSKIKACEEVGIHSFKRHLPATISEDDLLREIEQYNVNPDVDGILVQLPLPAHIDATRVTRWIDPSKDVDGFHPVNMGKLLIGESDGFYPCTPLGIKVLLERTEIDVAGKHVVILGRSTIVGKPMAAMLMQNAEGFNATVTLIHRQTPADYVKMLCKTADILIVAIGQPKYVTRDMIKEGVVIVDVGINRANQAELNSGKKIVGDVDFENVKDLCSFITPVPGGVGPMTIAMLLNNTLKSYQKRMHIQS